MVLQRKNKKSEGKSKFRETVVTAKWFRLYAIRKKEKYFLSGEEGQ